MTLGLSLLLHSVWHNLQCVVLDAIYEETSELQLHMNKEMHFNRLFRSLWMFLLWKCSKNWCYDFLKVSCKVKSEPHGWTLNTLCPMKISQTVKGHILCDPTRMEYLAQADRRQKVDSRLKVDVGSYCLTSAGCLFGVMKNAGSRPWWPLLNAVN